MYSYTHLFTCFWLLALDRNRVKQSDLDFWMKQTNSLSLLLLKALTPREIKMLDTVRTQGRYVLDEDDDSSFALLDHIHYYFQDFWDVEWVPLYLDRKTSVIRFPSDDYMSLPKEDRTLITEFKMEEGVRYYSLSWYLKEAVKQASEKIILE